MTAPIPGGPRLAIVVSRYNDFVCERLRAGALDGLASIGIAPQQVAVHWVPGAYEIPFAARALAATGTVDAIICLGCLIRGETAHFEYISSAVSDGLMQAQLETGVPMTFGVLTTHSAEQALARAVGGPANKGWEAALAAVEMARFRASIDEPGGSE